MTVAFFDHRDDHLTAEQASLIEKAVEEYCENHDKDDLDIWHKCSFSPKNNLATPTHPIHYRALREELLCLISIDYLLDPPCLTATPLATAQRLTIIKRCRSQILRGCQFGISLPTMQCWRCGTPAPITPKPCNSQKPGDLRLGR